MARIRSLKIGFFENEDLAKLTAHTRLLFEGLWLLADREGRLEDRPLRIKARIFPYEELDVEGMLRALEEAGFIVRYDADGVSAIQVVNFTRHQRPKSDEAASLIAAPILPVPRRTDAAPRISELGKDRGQRDRETEDRETEGVRADGARALSADGADSSRTDADGAEAHSVEDFAAAWNALTDLPIPRCRELSSARKRKVRARMTERPFDEWTQVFERIHASPFCRGDNDRGWTATFDWVIGSPDVAVKVLEGKYDDRRKTPRGNERAFTAQELADARRVLSNRQGRCPHDPPCESNQACVAAIIRKWRRERGEAA